MLLVNYRGVLLSLTSRALLPLPQYLEYGYYGSNNGGFAIAGYLVQETGDLYLACREYVSGSSRVGLLMSLNGVTFNAGSQTRHATDHDGTTLAHV